MPYDHSVISKEIDHYHNTIWGTVAFLHECCWNSDRRERDGSTHFGVGRTMDSPGRTQVTPDIVIQRNTSHGIAVEVKVTFPPNNEHGRRDKVFEQLKKYDADLVGWWTKDGKLSSHDLVLLTHFTKGIDAADHLSTMTQAGTVGFERRLAIVGFTRDDQNQSAITLSREAGCLSDASLSEKLRRRVSIPLKHLVPEQKSFCDSEPPLAYTLQVLWQNLFSFYLNGLSRDRTKGYIPIPVSVAKITTDLQRFYGYPSDGARNRGIPRSDWVERAMNMLSRLKLATHDGDPKAKKFIVHYRRIKGDLLVRFGRMIHELQATPAKKRSDRQQYELFADLE